MPILIFEQEETERTENGS